MKGLPQAFNFGRNIADNGWRMFTPFLVYKLYEQGIQLVKIGKRLSSTKICHYLNEYILGYVM